MFSKVSSTLKSRSPAHHSPSVRRFSLARQPIVKTCTRATVTIKEKPPVFRLDRIVHYPANLVPFDRLPCRGAGPFQQWAIEPGPNEDKILGPEHGVLFRAWGDAPFTGLEVGEYADRNSKYLYMICADGIRLLKEMRPQDTDRGVGTHSNLARYGFGGELWLQADGSFIVNACSTRSPVQVPKEYDFEKKIWKLPAEGTPERAECEARYRAGIKLFVKLQRATCHQVPLGQRWGKITPVRLDHTPLLRPPAASGLNPPMAL